MSGSFPDLAQRAFSFLERYSYRLTKRDAFRVKYEAASSVVKIEWDPRSGELNVLIGLLPTNNDPPDLFSLTDLLMMQHAEVPAAKMPFQVSNEDKLSPFLDELAKEMQTFAVPALVGDRMFFRRLRAFRNNHGQQLGRDMELRRVRTRAQEAWQKREFGKVITLYDSVEAYLTDSERAKLKYAKQHYIPGQQV